MVINTKSKFCMQIKVAVFKFSKFLLVLEVTFS